MMRHLYRWPGSRALSGILLIAVGFAFGFAAGQQGRITVAQDVTPEPTSEAVDAATPEPERIIPPEDQALLYPIWETYNLIRSSFRSPSGEGVSARGVIEGGIRGMIEALGDPNSYYIPASEREAFDRRVSAQTVGLGIVVATDEETGAVFIQSVIEPSPASEAGVEAGDIIIGIDGVDVTEMSQQEIVALARGEEGSSVTLTVDRDGETHEFTMLRSVITRPVVSAREIDGIGYIRLEQFSQNARPELDSALANLTDAGVSGLVIDLRGNAGGTSGATVQVASAFIPEGVIFTEDFGRRNRVFEVNGSHAGVDLPLAILINGRTQSAAEAFAGAIQDYGLGTIVGVPSFGKGTVQTVRDLSNGGGVRLTIARVLTPSGDTYHAVGVQPDIVVEDEEGPADEQLEAALAFLRGELVVTPEATEATDE